jgi:hypothetical protein
MPPEPVANSSRGEQASDECSRDSTAPRERRRALRQQPVDARLAPASERRQRQQQQQ